MTDYEQDLIDSCDTLIQYLTTKIDNTRLDLLRDEVSRQFDTLNELRGDIKREIAK